MIMLILTKYMYDIYVLYVHIMYVYMHADVQYTVTLHPQ